LLPVIAVFKYNGIPGLLYFFVQIDREHDAPHNSAWRASDGHQKFAIAPKRCYLVNNSPGNIARVPGLILTYSSPRFFLVWFFHAYIRPPKMDLKCAFGGIEENDQIHSQMDDQRLSEHVIRVTKFGHKLVTRLCPQP
jgi:hypothetical protein